MQSEIIKKYFYTTNSLVLYLMYLNSIPNNEIFLENLKNYNPGHLGTSLSINFILSNLYYFLNKNNMTSQIIIGTGHAGVSLLSNLWLNGTLKNYNNAYSCNKKGLDNLIKDFGQKIRAEINPEYPQTIYDGGELGYSLGVAYGYAIDSNVDLVPCIIGDGEAETGTLSSSWMLSKLLNTKSKVLPIINLNGLKMGSNSILSSMSDDELYQYFGSMGYEVQIISSDNLQIEDVIKNMQASLDKTIKQKKPLLIFKSLKGYTLNTVDDKKFEGNKSVHKNPLQPYNEKEKLKIIKKFLETYDFNIFDYDGNLLEMFNNFNILYPLNFKKNIHKCDNEPNESIDEYLYKLIKANDGIIFSPDEIYSNMFHKCSKYSLEILNENLLQALYQGYIQAGNFGYFISYEGFMPIISSMITQYYKYLKQKDVRGYREEKNSLNYILTSTCWENTYSHQNPDFVNSLYEKEDKYYNILYPKDVNCVKHAINEFSHTHDTINIITFSKRHSKVYSNSNNVNNTIEVIKNSDTPDLIICVTGDYLLDLAMKVYDDLKNTYSIKIVYVTKPQILNINNDDSLNKKDFEKYFNKDTPIIYLYSGYANTIKSLLYDRKIDCNVLGYNDGISTFGNLENNLNSNGMSKDDIIKICESKLKGDKVLKLRRKI